MGLPNLSIIFQELAKSATARSSKGVVALIVKDTVPAVNPIVLTPDSVVPITLTPDNQEQINLAFLGGTTASAPNVIYAPSKVIVYVLPVEAVDYSLAQTYLETIKWSYLVVPDILSTETVAMATWIKGLRDDMDIRVKAVLPNAPSDHEGIINYDTDGAIVGDKTYTAIQYCSRIAGILAGIPLSMSATYQILKEVDDVPHNTIAQFDTLIDTGNLVLMNDTEKVKIARAINSLVTLTDKDEDFQKIKIVDIMDLIHDDIKSTYNDNYVGQIPNDYNHKCILITAINAYLLGLETQNLLDNTSNNSVQIDIDAQTTFLKNSGIDTSSMTDIQIKNANTGTSVFLTGTATPLDAMEDLALILSL